ncbi:hypothetical protein M0R45_017106 [Rubus argutus]|uniref:Uncharacterized protein n=1 Tax=Rubus argutus TaxID=59490 RepID=A0AAW1XV74_RUBAR
MGHGGRGRLRDRDGDVIEDWWAVVERAIDAMGWRLRTCGDALCDGKFQHCGGVIVNLAVIAADLWIGDCGWDPRTDEHKCGGGGFRLFR